MSASDLMSMYRLMYLIRRTEETLGELYRIGEVYGSLHLCIGQEATVVGACSALRPDDYMTCTYRGHGAVLAKGTPVETVFAELLGRRSGCCRGRGGSMLLTDLSVGNLGATGIVAAGLPIAVGAALSAKLSRQSKVAITFFGDGATNQGAFHEALNLAAVWKAPCVFFCENNQYAEMTPISKEVAIVSLAERACAYGLPGVTVDGNDVEEVFKVTLEAVQRAREGDGPTLIEAITYRLSGHMYGDPETYRSKDEVQKWRERDPLAIARNRLIERGTPIDLIAAVEKQVDAEIQEAVQRARSSPEPDPEEAELYVYARPA